MNHILLPELLPKQCPHLLKESLFTTSCLYSPVASRVDCKPLHFLYDVSNNYWQGLLFHRYADIYTSRVSNFLRYSPFMYFRSQSQVWMTSSTIIKPLGFLLYGLTHYNLNMSVRNYSYMTSFTGISGNVNLNLWLSWNTLAEVLALALEFRMLCQICTFKYWKVRQGEKWAYISCWVANSVWSCCAKGCVEVQHVFVHVYFEIWFWGNGLNRAHVSCYCRHVQLELPFLMHMSLLLVLGWVKD